MTRRGFSDHGALTLQPSRIMLGFLAGTHLLALASLYLSNLNTSLVLFLSLAIVSHGYHAYGQFFRLTGNNVVKRIWHNNNLWFLMLADGRQVQVELNGEMVVLDWFVSLQFRDQDRKYPVVVWSDSAHADEFRHLRVWLRLNAGQALSG